MRSNEELQAHKKTIGITGEEIKKINENMNNLHRTNTDGIPATEMELRQSVKDYNINTQRAQLGIEIMHSYYNHKQIWEDMHEGTGRDVSTAKIDKPEPALIVGSGQSLNKAHDLLKNWKGAIFSSTSQSTTLIHAGVKDRLYIVALDPKLQADEFIGVDDWTKYGATLVIQPCIAPVIFELWKGPKLYFRIMEPTTEFYTRNLAIAYRWITTYLFLFSCSLSAQMGLAAAMGYNPLILVGCGFGAPENKYRFTRWDNMPIDIDTTNKETGEKIHYDKWDDIPLDIDLDVKINKRRWEASKGGSLDSKKAVVANNGVLTDAMQLYYKRSVLCVARLDMKDVINTSTEGIITEFPEATIEEVIKNQGQGLEDRYYTKLQKWHTYEKYLATQDTYVICFKKKGMRFIESKDPVKEVPPFLGLLQQQIKKDNKLNDLDIEANIKRITRLKTWADKQLQLHQQRSKDISKK